MLEFFLGLAKSVNWKAASGVLFGAAIGALVSYFLQRNSFAEARRQKELDKREERRTLGLNVLTKMIRIASTLELLMQSLEQAFARAEKDGIKGPPWTIVIPLANFPAKVHFEPKELTEIMKLDFNLFNDLGPFDDVHNTLLDVFQLYRTDRNALTSTLSAEMNGMLGSTTLTPEEVKRLAPKMAALDTIIDGMVQRTTTDSAEAWSILNRLQDALNREFGLKLRLERKPFSHQPIPPGSA
ncbi:hypothetical protein [Bradyrhizobium sp.]|uniref:hypothetical protein n=1 Tax=Bradyrhizobium sp. TaxID=376 RepID=UPI0040382B63